MITTNDERLARTLRDLNTPDMRESYRVRYNYKMSDLAAGLALNQFGKLNRFVERRRQIAGLYRKHLSSLSAGFQRILPSTEPSFYRFVVFTPQAEEMIRFAQHHGISCDKPVYKPLHHFDGSAPNLFRGTDRAWATAVSIPIYPALQNNEVQAVIGLVAELFKHADAPAR